jgi:hypothetical protein
MSEVRRELINATLSRVYNLTDHKMHNDIHKEYEFRKQMVLADESLTKDEKNLALKKLNRDYDRHKIRKNEGPTRICENCNQECLATSYCEHCVRNYLKEKLSNWTSGNDDIDNLIQKCQSETLMPSKVIEWIPYNNLRNIKYLTRGGFSEIYTAIWIDGGYEVWDSENKQLKRTGAHTVVLKRLETVEKASQSWFEEVGNFEVFTI